MFIYTVKLGDSLYAISQKFDISVEAIRIANRLTATIIVPGQALLINNSIYTVQPGDSFYTISKMAYVSLDMLTQANPVINPNFLQPGMKIILPELPDYFASTLSYLYITGTTADQNLIKDFNPYTTYYAFFEYHINSDGSLNQLEDLEAIATAWNNNSAPLATITNLTAEGFSPELTSGILNNSSTRETLIDSIFTLVSTRGYAGVNIDFEGTLAEDRDIFSTFLSALADRLHAAGFFNNSNTPKSE